MHKFRITLALFCLSIILLQAQSHTEKINKTFTFEKKSVHNAVLIHNIDGHVTVEGIAGDQIIVEVEKIITAKTDARLALGKEEIQLGIVDLADTLIFYVKGWGQEFGRKSNKWGNSGHGEWGYIWNQRDNQREDKQYDYTMNFKVKIPTNTHIIASTVNDGDVLITNTNGKVKAHNVNGHIKIKNISGGTVAHTINGNVDIDYAKNPSTDCKYYTLNGDIHVNFPGSVSGQMTFKSFNGDLYTNIDPLIPLPAVIHKKENEKGIKYKVEHDRYQIRTGGPMLDVETFNGDAFLKERVNNK